MVEALSAVERIRTLNDTFRTTFLGGKVLLTAGVDALPASVKSAVIDRVKSFSDFRSGNDPQDEHDLISFEFEGVQYFGKIDYYDQDQDHGSDDPSDASKTIRVLTIMLASEY